MVTNLAQQLTALTTRAGRREADAGLLARAIDALRQAYCGLRGHDSLLHFEANRVLLRCTSCGYESPGWEIGPRRPRLRFEGDVERHLLRRPSPPAIELRKTA
ncbi:MAG TPA: hypothetical protein VNK92_06240 [Vicinamibacterales bacterium]|jgi:hypothetical protein|nr:hypothetical protein [Vicinamibacterales bacterium]